MDHSIEAESRLIGRIYDAAMNPALWPGVMDAIAARTQARTANILAYDTLNPAYNLVFPHNIPDACYEEYHRQGWNRVDMEVLGAALAQYGIGVPHNSVSLFDSLDAMRAEIGDYLHFLQKWEMSCQAGALLDHGDFRWSVIGIHRPESQGFFEPEALAFLGRMTAHLRRALQIHRQLIAVKDENQRIYAMLDALATGIILLDSGGHIRYANPRAASLIREHGALDVRQEHVYAALAPQNEKLQALIRSAIDTSQHNTRIPSLDDAHGGVIGLNSADRTSPLMLTVVPLSSLESWQDLSQDNIAAAIFLSDPDHGHEVSARLLRDNYRLTPREASICQHFINTPALETIAERCGLSLESVRSYLKTIYEKTGQHSQAELMRLLMGLRIDFEHIR